MTSSGSKIRVAILGGGLAGAALFRGLVKHPHLQVDIFESAPEFREAGQGIGFNANAVWALEKLGLRGCMDKADAVRMSSVRFMIAEGPNKGEQFLEHKDLRERGTWIMQRTRFLEQLLQGVDPAAMHAGKKLSSLEQQSDGCHLSFADGSTHVCDILFGADGIHSTVRKYVIGHDHPAADPIFAGWWTVWKLKPYHEAVKHLEHQYIDPESPSQYGWIGKNGFMMHDLLSNNTLVQCVQCTRVPEESLTDMSKWLGTTTRPAMAEHCKDYISHLSKGMVELVTEEHPEPTPKMSMWHHKPAPTYANGGIAIVGDAADACTPWQGSGGGLAMEDAVLLSALFGQARTVAEARAALSAYDYVHRPRRQKLVKGSYDTGLLVSGCYPGVGLDKAKLLEKLEFNWDWIIDADLDANSSEALTKMKELAA